MTKRWKVLLTGALGALLMAAPAVGQRAEGPAFSSGYENSTLMQQPSGNPDNSAFPPVYPPYWQNYLDNLQKEGGYYSVTGNYPNSVPITSYYPASPGDGAIQQPAGQQAQGGAYYNPGEQYPQSGGYGYQQQPQGYQQQSQYPQQYQGSQGYQTAAPQAATGKKSSKKRSSAAQQRSAEAAQAYQQQSPYQQAQAYQQQQYSQQQQQYMQQQQQQYGQQQYPQQQYGQQGAYQQQQAQESAGQSGLSGDPIVQEAQRKAYERAVARQRAAELAAHQQAAAQELQQTQQMYLQAQQKLREQEEKQRTLQAEYHKKAVGDAYEGLRAAQQRYYQLMGVSGESGGGPQQAAQAQQARAAQQPAQYPQAAPMNPRLLSSIRRQRRLRLMDNRAFPQAPSPVGSAFAVLTDSAGAGDPAPGSGRSCSAAGGRRTLGGSQGDLRTVQQRHASQPETLGKFWQERLGRVGKVSRQFSRPQGIFPLEMKIPGGTCSSAPRVKRRQDIRAQPPGPHRTACRSA